MISVVIGGLLLAGCTSAVEQARQSSTATPTRGGTITVAQSVDAIPGSILTGKAGNDTWESSVFQTLTAFNSKLQPQPLLATSWKLASNAMSIDIHLRGDVKFQTGRKMTADDVKWTFQKAAAKATGAQLGYIAREFTAINVVSPTELTIDFSKPLSNIFDFFDATPIVDKDTYAGLANGSQVIGTGPYLFTDWQQGSSFVLKRWRGYRDPNAAKLNQIDFVVLTDPTALMNAVRSSRAQIAYGLSTSNVQSFAKNDQYRIVDAGGSIYPLGVNVTTAPFDNVKVRQAVAYAIDRNRINKELFSGTGTPTDLFWSPEEPGYSSGLAAMYAYDPAKAKQLIQQAGAKGATVSISVINASVMQQLAQIVSNNLQAIGLNAQIKMVDIPTFAAHQVAGTLGTAFMPVHGQVGFSAATLLNSLPTLRQGNSSKFWTAQYAKLRNALMGASTATAQAQALQNLSRYMLQQAFAVPILQAPNQVLEANTVHSVGVSPFGLLDFTSAYTS